MESGAGAIHAKQVGEGAAAQTWAPASEQEQLNYPAQLDGIPEETSADAEPTAMDMTTPNLEEEFTDQLQQNLGKKELTFTEPTAIQKKALLKAHQNLGHPQPPEFLQALRAADVPLNIRAWVKHHFSCPQCEANRRPG
eukprot:5341333-Amphidinium_carterae.2